MSQSRAEPRDFMYLWGCRVEGVVRLGDEILLAYRVVLIVLFTK